MRKPFATKDDAWSSEQTITPCNAHLAVTFRSGLCHQFTCTGSPSELVAHARTSMTRASPRATSRRRTAGMALASSPHSLNTVCTEYSVGTRVGEGVVSVTDNRTHQRCYTQATAYRKYRVGLLSTNNLVASGFIRHRIGRNRAESRVTQGNSPSQSHTLFRNAARVPARLLTDFCRRAEQILHLHCRSKPLNI